jgi:multicomponent Na+:H+ antiporter subunit A
MSLLPLSVVAAIALGFVAPALWRVLGPRLGRVLALFPAGLFVAFAAQSPQVSDGVVLEAGVTWIPALDVRFGFFLDGLGLLFALLITGIGALVFFYADWYLSDEEDHGKFFAYLLMFMAAMLGVVMADNLLLLFLFWEVTSFTSFLLIGFWWHRDASRYGALKALLITAGGGLALMAGLIVVYVVTGSLSLTELLLDPDPLRDATLYPVVLVLFCWAAFSKAAQFPFHIWLPNAMEAPTPVSAYLHSAAMVKAGIYLIARMFPVLGDTTLWFVLVGGVGLTTLVLGSTLALRQRDLKAVLAYSTISQLGLIVALFGWGTSLAVTAATFHILNHSVFKAALFMGVGIVDHEAHTRNVDRLGGLARLMPYTAAVMGLGALGLAGIPPFNGFISKEMFFDAAVIEAGAGLAGTSPLGLFAVALPVLAVVGSVLNFSYAALMFHGVFFGPQSTDLPHIPHDPPKAMLAPPLLLGGLALGIGVLPWAVDAPLVAPAAGAALGVPADYALVLWHGFNLPLLMSAVVIAFGFIAYSRVRAFRSAQLALPRLLSVNRFYDWAVDGLVVGSERLTGAMFTGFTRDYFAWFQAFFLATVALAAIAMGGVVINPTDIAPIGLTEAALFGLALLGGLAVLLLPTRLGAVISLGLVGFTIVLLFTLFRAPDLAMTQLIVETVTLIIFLLVFIHLPRLLKGGYERRRASANAVVSVLSGVAVTVLMLAALSAPMPDGVSSWYLANAVDLAGGRNVVNVILVDFRALDTLGEIVVLGLAALGVLMILSLRSGAGRSAKHERMRREEARR